MLVYFTWKQVSPYSNQLIFFLKLFIHENLVCIIPIYQNYYLNFESMLVIHSSDKVVFITTH